MSPNLSTRRILAAFALPLVLSAAASAQTPPQPAPPAPEIAAPADTPYPGTIRLAVDATDLTHAIFAVHETIPVKPGPVTLLYPRWLPGTHAPSGAIDKLAGLIVSAGGKRLEWRRDPVDVYAFHLDVPQGVDTLDVSFQFLSAVSMREGRIMMTADMLSLQWIQLLLYPSGYFTRQIPIAASVTLPDGFTPATALEVQAAKGAAIDYKPTNIETLADSPMIAGRYFKAFELDPGGPARVTLDVVADRPEQLDASSAEIDAHKALVTQAYRLFGSHHYGHYDFLFSLSDKMGGNGLEHHQSSEDGTLPKYFTDWDKTPAGRDLLSHEYTHSWNGKFRRPADLWTPNYNVPERDSLLWVYEGQTQYWGYVLAARAGLWTKQQALDALALVAATYDHRVGRRWRPLEDTTNDPIIANRRPLSWLSWQRSEDYYSEAQLVWLDCDTLIRDLSQGKKSLDDFASFFFGIDNGSFVPVTYGFDDIVAGLEAVQPYDWADVLRQRLDGIAAGAPLDGIARGGYRLTYDETETPFQKSVEGRRKSTDLLFSAGLVMAKDGVVTEVLWDSPAFKAGLTEGTQLVAVNGDPYDPDGLKDAIAAAKTVTAPIELIVKSDEHYRTVKLDYHDGLQYPHLQRIDGTKPLLDDILAAR
jgi:predicted metalloprotease with PDZ domain